MLPDRDVDVLEVIPQGALREAPQILHGPLGGYHHPRARTEVASVPLEILVVLPADACHIPTIMSDSVF